ncbi:hypothetical protein A1O3_00005 [Capronia epimyces CBS 606.96]|uniref:DNA-directed RNA polymerase III subunit RPC3 n=1 Tax=Capronia epimyces CBS 606.96 TaxID=1182542 RepID=W9YF08_9EURO|nr:uncharacterized protein A1O3_00005 [Capronia epimyces CBS 606.96]EXJ91457.1 hypothetical protein A1O3_00005 [Capronia epimyces CBS 606.96]
MEHLTILGYATADELEVRVSEYDRLIAQEETAAYTNGRLAHSPPPGVNTNSRAGFRSALKHLIDNRFIVCVRDAHFQSQFDARRDIERHLAHLEGLPAAKGKKIQSDIDRRVDIELGSRLDASISSTSVLQDLQEQGLNGENMTYSEYKTMLCIDYSNLVISVRNEKVAFAADKLFGKPVAQVARAACLQADVDSGPYKLRDCTSTPAPIQRLNVAQICSDLAEIATLENQIGEGVENGWPLAEYAVNGHRGPHTDGAMHPQQIDHQLAVLAEGPFHFFSQDHVGGHWLLHKTELNNFLRDKELMRLMGESLSGPALRTVRILMDKGKLDEKSLQEIGLLGAKELRQCLARLQMMGLLELQEVPREPQRQPNRTIFLWFYDPERVRKVFLGRLYKTMARLFQRLQLEREKLASTLSKVERTDVQGSEEEMLSPAELQVLFQWRQKEAWFMAEISRLDDSVVILRDL